MKVESERVICSHFAYMSVRLLSFFLHVSFCLHISPTYAWVWLRRAFKGQDWLWLLLLTTQGDLVPLKGLGRLEVVWSRPRKKRCVEIDRRIETICLESTMLCMCICNWRFAHAHWKICSCTLKDLVMYTENSKIWLCRQSGTKCSYIGKVRLVHLSRQTEMQAKWEEPSHFAYISVCLLSLWEDKGCMGEWEFSHKCFPLYKFLFLF